MGRIGNIETGNPFFGRGVALGVSAAGQSAWIQGVEGVGSLSVSQMQMVVSASSTTLVSTGSLTIQIGIYTRNASTLTLVNSGSFSTTNADSTGFRSWVTLALSTTADLAPGNWWVGFWQSTGGNSRFSAMGGGANISLRAGAIGGSIPVRGWAAFTSSSIPASINITDVSGEGTTGNDQVTRFPYVLISG